MPRYAELVYNGFWFSPEREALQAAIDQTQKFVTGTVRLKLYKVRPTRPGPRRQTDRSFGGIAPTWTPAPHRAPHARTLQSGLGRSSRWRSVQWLALAPEAAAWRRQHNSHHSAHARRVCLQGNVTLVGRKSPYSLYNQKLSSFEDDEGLYDQKDAAGFIKLQALRLRTMTAARGSFL
jgi:argininosuccinate synthase